MTLGTYERLGVTVGDDDLTLIRRARGPDARGAS
jgi:hypothetical protein